MNADLFEEISPVLEALDVPDPEYLQRWSLEELLLGVEADSRLVAQVREMLPGGGLEGAKGALRRTLGGGLELLMSRDEPGSGVLIVNYDQHGNWLQDRS